MDKVFAVVSAYRPEITLLENCRNVLSQFSTVIIVDDGSGAEYGAVLDQCAEIGCVVIKSAENLGIAAALNTGIQRAWESGAGFVMTLDQDTNLPAGYVAKMLVTFQAAKKEKLPVAFVSPLFANKVSAKVENRLAGFSFLGETMQSGMLIPVETFMKIGLLDEQLFIDCVDTEYFLRAKSFGLKNLACPDLDSNHNWGKMLPFVLFGRAISYKGRSLHILENPLFRYYYICRNRKILYKKYSLNFPAWAFF